MKRMGKHIRNTVYGCITVVAAAAWACDSGDDPRPEFTATLNGTPYVTATTTGKFLVIHAAGPWTIDIAFPQGQPEGWCRVDPQRASGTGNANVWIYTDKNTAANQREAIITVTSDDRSVHNVLVQYGTVIPINTQGLELPAIRDTAWLLDYKTGKFMLEYAPEKKHSKWVAWPLYRGCMGSSGRTDAWAFDARIPAQYSPTRADFYGYDRGHMCPSADRTATVAMNRETFYYSNMSPQVGVGFNQGIWANLEIRERGWVSNVSDTIYICAGGTVMRPSDIDHYTSPSSMAVPKYYFKVILRKRAGNVFDAIGFWFENKAYDRPDVTSADVQTVRWIEERTGFDFFHNLDPAVQNQVETAANPAAWGIN